MISKALATSLTTALGSEVMSSRPLAGGDICRAYEATLASGLTLFVKTHTSAPRGLFEAEAKGLTWLAQPKALRVPNVLGYSKVEDGQVPFLALEYIKPGTRAADYAAQLGRGLASVHRAGAEAFGLPYDNYIAVIPQPNAPAETWWEFYRDCRLEPMLDRAAARGSLPTTLRLRFDQLYAQLPELVGPSEPPARLHGDLWSGNAMCDDKGMPCLVDPAVYGGHREMDLAMMQLFGGFERQCFDAYNEAYPLSDGYQDRVPLYQLYPLLVHLNLFGAGYLGSLERTLDLVLH
jgi:fructosamine-3-kinase